MSEKKVVRAEIPPTPARPYNDETGFTPEETQLVNDLIHLACESVTRGYRVFDSLDGEGLAAHMESFVKATKREDEADLRNFINKVRKLTPLGLFVWLARLVGTAKDEGRISYFDVFRSRPGDVEDMD